MQITHCVLSLTLAQHLLATSGDVLGQRQRSVGPFQGGQQAKCSNCHGSQVLVMRFAPRHASRPRVMQKPTAISQLRSWTKANATSLSRAGSKALEVS